MRIAVTAIGAGGSRPGKTIEIPHVLKCCIRDVCPTHVDIAQIIKNTILQIGTRQINTPKRRRRYHTLQVSIAHVGARKPCRRICGSQHCRA